MAIIIIMLMYNYVYYVLFISGILLLLAGIEKYIYFQ